MSRNKWMTSEIAILKRIFLTASASELEAALPRHPLGSIRDMAYRQKLRKGATRTGISRRKWDEIAARHVPTFRFGGV